jgi:hypothetical protein
MPKLIGYYSDLVLMNHCIQKNNKQPGSLCINLNHTGVFSNEKKQFDE